MASPITGNDTPNTLTGTTGDDTIYGYGAGDHLYGLDGDDILDGGTGNDVMNGGAGNDTYYVDSAKDWIIDLSGTDSIFASVSYSLVGEAVESITLTGAANINATGNALNNHLYGNGGNNILDGGTGADVMAGGAGNDTYYVDNVHDWIIDSSGNDTVYAYVGYSIAGMQVENLHLLGNIKNLNATGNSLGNFIFGNNGNNIIDGGAGADRMTGGLGDDTYYVDNSKDVVGENPNGGNDTVYASASYTSDGNIENLYLIGTGNFTLGGDTGNNLLVGNSGNNSIAGHGGLDNMTGGAGNDTFYFDAFLGAQNVGSITDFTVGEDMIALDRTIFSMLSEDGALPASAFVAGTAATTSSQHIVYDSGTGNIYYDRDGNGSAAKVLFAHVTPGLAVTATSFTVYN